MRKSDQRLQTFAENAEQTAHRQRDIQKEVDRADKAATGIKDKKSQTEKGVSYPASTGYGYVDFGQPYQQPLADDGVRS
jgi:hypothetical protein